jgi:hypothetical protein
VQGLTALDWLNFTTFQGPNAGLGTAVSGWKTGPHPKSLETRLPTAVSLKIGYLSDQITSLGES